MTINIREVNANNSDVLLHMKASDLVLITNVFYEWLKEHDGKAKHYKLYKDMYITKELCKNGTIAGIEHKIIDLNKKYLDLSETENENK